MWLVRRKRRAKPLKHCWHLKFRTLEWTSWRWDLSAVALLNALPHSSQHGPLVWLVQRLLLWLSNLAFRSKDLLHFWHFNLFLLDWSSNGWASSDVALTSSLPLCLPVEWTFAVWWLLMWLARQNLRAKRRSHCWHLKFLILEWTSWRWDLSAVALLNDLPHSLQLMRTLVDWCFLMWAVRRYLRAKLLLHCLQGNFFSAEWTSCRWNFSAWALLSILPHWPQGVAVFLLWTVSTCLTRL